MYVKDGLPSAIAPSKFPADEARRSSRDQEGIGLEVGREMNWTSRRISKVIYSGAKGPCARLDESSPHFNRGVIDGTICHLKRYPLFKMHVAAARYFRVIIPVL
jgi:hypothetical protein